MTKFNFLDRRTASAKAAADLRRQFPNRSPAWTNAAAQRTAGTDLVTTELRAPTRSVTIGGTK
jgi:hypothetical protein